MMENDFRDMGATEPMSAVENEHQFLQAVFKIASFGQEFLYIYAGWF